MDNVDNRRDEDVKQKGGMIEDIAGKSNEGSNKVDEGNVEG